MRIQSKKTWVGIFLLVLLEQSIKLVINKYYLYRKIPIIPQVLYFAPMFNRRYSWFNSMLKLGYGKWVHIVMAAIIIVLIYLFYRYISKELGNSRIINIMFAFIFSGAVCSIIDKIFWDGSLDYISITGLFTFDLKDLYIDIFIVIMILSVLLGNKTLKQMEDMNVLKGFSGYILRKSQDVK